MLCKRPFIQGVLPFGCGQCLPCRINRRRLWSHRMLLESFKHPESSFVTLTYSDEFLPRDGSLVPKDTQDWLKRLRKAVDPLKIRYFLVGEYGDQTWRPHYHAALFGVGYSYTDVIEKSWSRDGKPIGHVMVGDLTKDSCQYIAGYVTKKMTSKNDDRCVLNNIHPEFARMSRKPGIGAVALPEITDCLTSQFGVISLQKERDVPSVLKMGKSSLLLGRYLRGKLREKIASEKGVKKIKQENIEKYVAEMRAMLEDSRSNEGGESVFKSVREVHKENFAQQIINLETKTKIYSARKKL